MKQRLPFRIANAGQRRAAAGRNCAITAPLHRRPPPAAACGRRNLIARRPGINRKSPPGCPLIRTV